jgi:glutamine synthetase adenylyltransferase
VCAYSDNIRQLAALARSGVVTSIDENTLAQAYQGYRAMAHRQAMSGEKGLVSYEDVTQWREAVANIWHQVFVV